LLIDECLSEIGNEPTFSKEFSERLADHFQTTGKRTENFQTIKIFNRECGSIDELKKLFRTELNSLVKNRKALIHQASEFFVITPEMVNKSTICHLQNSNTNNQYRARNIPKC